MPSEHPRRSPCRDTNIGPFNLNALRVFTTVFEEGSASRAAIRLNVTQSAVSATLQQLRELYHDPLFERTGRGLTPTLYAKQIYPIITESLSQLDNTLSRYAGRQGLFEGRAVTIGMSDDFEMALGPHLVTMTKELLPAGRLRFKQTNTQLVTEMLLAREIDIAITAGGVSNDALNHISVGTGTYGCLVDPAVFKVPFTLENCILHEHILVGFNGFVGVVNDVLEPLGARRSVRVSTSHFAAVPYFLHGTDTIITIPRHAAKATAEISPMQYHECPVTYPSNSVELSWRRTSRRDPMSTRLIEAFSERLALKL